MKRVINYILVYLCLVALVCCFLLGLYSIITEGTMREVAALVNGVTFILGSCFCISTIVDMHERDRHNKLMREFNPEKKLDDIRLNTLKLIEQENKSEINGEDVFNTLQDCLLVINYLIKTRNK